MDAASEKLAQKVNFWFRKRGPAIYFSHLDLMRHFCRSLRRAGLRPRLTAGFNPRPRLVFPHPMPLGVASDCETAEVEFCEELPLGEVFARLRRADGGVLEFLRCEAMRPVKAGHVVARCTYRVGNLPPAAASPEFAAWLRETLAAPAITMTRGHAEKARAVDIRPYILSLRLVDGELEAELAHLPEGAGRIDEIARLAAARLGCPWQTLALTKTAVAFRE